MLKKAFAAFPGGLKDIRASIEEVTSSGKTGYEITPWPKLDIVGLRLDNLIRERIREADALIADITFPNFNVYYEVGYALGVGKALIPIVNTAFESHSGNVSLTGIFDVLGYLPYQNSVGLAKDLERHDLNDFTSPYIKPRNFERPLYIVSPLVKPEFINYTVATTENTFVASRSYDPDENARMYAATAIGDVSSSAGVIIPLLNMSMVQAQIHNLKAAFVAGLCHGLEIEPLILQYDDAPAPADYREMIKTARTRREVQVDVEDYCQKTLINNQKGTRYAVSRDRTVLEDIDLGASTAENEANLDVYFVPTAQYKRAERATGAVVVGRKGSGKTAIFQGLLSNASKDKRNLVIELAPSSHNLSELRERLLSVMTAGVFDHTMVAFWQYIVYTEILLKLREIRLPASKNSLTLQDEIRRLEDRFNLGPAMVAGDFTSRLDIAINAVIGGMKALPPGSDAKPLLTNILFENQIPALRDFIVTLSAPIDGIFLFFDNLDKGWPSFGIEAFDIRTIRHLIETLTRLRRDMGKKDIDIKHVVFLRSDVYDLLVEHTSDREKYNPIPIDWSDPEQLRRVIYDRIGASVAAEKLELALASANPCLQDGQYALDILMDASMMRPRFLIDLCENMLTFAINRKHGAVLQNDLEDALKVHSRYLVNNFGFEIRDVSHIPADFVRRFKGKTNLLTKDEVIALMDVAGQQKSEAVINQDIQVLVASGFLGVMEGERPTYIYNLGYDVQEMKSRCDNFGSDILYKINPAFTRGLSDALSDGRSVS